MFISKAIAATEEAAHGAADAAHGAAEAAHGSGVFPPFDPSTFASQIFWLALTFGLFYLFMSKVISPRLGEIIETREDRIAQDLAKARELKDQADEAVAAYEQDLATARTKANEIGQKARDAAKVEADGERARVEAELADKIAGAEQKIATIRAKAMSEVGTIAEDTASELVSKLLGGTVSKADIAKAVAAVK